VDIFPDLEVSEVFEWQKVVMSDDGKYLAAIIENPKTQKENRKKYMSLFEYHPIIKHISSFPRRHFYYINLPLDIVFNKSGQCVCFANEKDIDILDVEKPLNLRFSINNEHKIVCLAFANDWKLAKREI